MSYKAVRTDRHKLIHWIHKDGVDELYDLEQDPYEMTNAIADPAHAETLKRLRRELRTLVADAVGL
jgi:arylsulfatase A-like enzyme